MRILLTGKDGQLGWELRQRLEQNHDLIAVSRDDLNFQDAHHLHNMIKRLPELALIVNCAAYTDVDRAEHEPMKAELINTEAPAILAAEADRRGIPMIHFSTDYVFNGKNHKKPYKETDRPNPLSVYGWSKLAGEQRVREICEKHLIFRLSGLYSIRRRNFFTTMLRYIHTNQTPCVVNDQQISPNWCPMVAEAIQHVIQQVIQSQQNIWGTYHLSGTGSTTWHHFASQIFEKASEVFGKNLAPPIPVSSKEFKAAAIRPEYSVLNPTKFNMTFGYSLPHWSTQFLHCINGVSSENR